MFPRFKYWDRTKKEVTYPLEPNMSFAELVVKTKELIVPEQKILKSKDELENFLKTNKHAMVANIDSKDSEQAAVLNELVKASKFESSMVFDIAKVEATDLEAEFPAYKEKGIHFHTINSEGENIFKKYPYNLENHDEIVASIISFFEMESYPDVFFFNSKLFNDIFANHINTQFIYFTTDPESAKTKEAVKILKKASKFNKQEDLLSQRIAFVVFKIGLNPGVEASFSNL